MTKPRIKAVLALADGSVYEGLSFGAAGEAVGEAVFNTSMTGYQEIITDPSYRGQMVLMTYTQIGNYGINPEDVESDRPWVEAFIVKEYMPYPSNWRHTISLGDYFKENGIVGIEGVDTRAITRKLRVEGSMMAAISSLKKISVEGLIKKARKAPPIEGKDLVKEVTCRESKVWSEGEWKLGEGYTSNKGKHRFEVAALDFGIKSNILRMLTSRSVNVTVYPANTSAGKILERKPDGLFLSNGPGDPAAVPYAIKTVRKLLGKVPIFGICLGHQILGLAAGGTTYKLKFGHHGANQPVRDEKTGKVEITAQNHCFAVDVESVKKAGMRLTHINLNDQTSEGMEHVDMPAFSVQYHPEASPGPHDSAYLFDRFIEMMKKVNK